MQLTYDQLEAISPHSTDIHRLRYLKHLNTYMPKYYIDTKERVASFLAQVIHESGSFRYTEELADGSNYEWRKDLGNLEPIALHIAHANFTTSGKFYKGRGLIQITGYYNYRDCGKALSLDLINTPKLLTIPKYATESACWFWYTHNCNALASLDKFDAITRQINGGYNGKKERDANYKLAKTVLYKEKV